MALGRQGGWISPCEGRSIVLWTPARVTRVSGRRVPGTPSWAPHSQYLNVVHNFMDLSGNAHLPAGSKELFLLELLSMELSLALSLVFHCVLWGGDLLSM